MEDNKAARNAILYLFLKTVSLNDYFDYVLSPVFTNLSLMYVRHLLTKLIF